MKIVLLAAVVISFSCSSDPQQVPDLGAPPGQAKMLPAATAADVNPRLLRRFQSITPLMKDVRARAAEPRVVLGKMLYFDKRLSADNDLSCESCHHLSKYGVDNEPTSIGRKGERVRRNSPSTLHAAGHVAQFWDGRALDVEEQALGPITSRAEMGMETTDKAVAALKAVPGYRQYFEAAFPGSADPITGENIGRAIGAFERTLLTPSRWDLFLDGDKGALTPAEVEGLKIFADVGCVECHTGMYIGASMFKVAGQAEAWPNQNDQGRYEVTGQSGDRMQFKVPSLRNVAMTAPYFHDGSVASLEDAVQMMAKHQVGTVLSQEETASIVEWLKALTGELPQEHIRAPVLP